jgi:ABC-type cobalamin/Fe3+-siderophores transport system ATPase subunit
LLRAADLSFAYADRPVLTGVSLDVPPGGFVGIIGPNGSGKTTLLRLLAGTRVPRAGSVTLEGRPLTSIRRHEIAKRMAVVPQETHLAFDYTVLEVVLMGRFAHLGAFEIEGPADIAIARQSLASTGTEDLADRAFNTLSGGEKQRVIIAAALAQVRDAGRGAQDAGRRTQDDGRGVGRAGLGPGTSHPALPAGARSAKVGPSTPHPGPPADARSAKAGILLLDEPTAALDLKYQLEIAALLRDLHDTHALSIVLSTHDLNFAAALCDTLVMMQGGRVLASGPVDDVLTPALIDRLYDVESEVTRHPRTGHLMVVPVGRSRRDEDRGAGR